MIILAHDLEKHIDKRIIIYEFHVLNLILTGVHIIHGNICQLTITTLNRLIAMMQIPTILHVAGVATRLTGL